MKCFYLTIVQASVPLFAVRHIYLIQYIVWPVNHKTGKTYWQNKHHNPLTSFVKVKPELVVQKSSVIWGLSLQRPTSSSALLQRHLAWNPAAGRGLRRASRRASDGQHGAGTFLRADPRPCSPQFRLTPSFYIFLLDQREQPCWTSARACLKTPTVNVVRETFSDHSWGWLFYF